MAPLSFLILESPSPEFDIARESTVMRFSLSLGENPPISITQLQSVRLSHSVSPSIVGITDPSIRFANRILGSVIPTMLGETLCESLTLCNCVILIGGFSPSDKENLITVLSRAISNSGLGLSNIRKLKGAITDGYIIKYDKQIIIALPDNPEEIKFILNDNVLDYLKSVYQ